MKALINEDKGYIVCPYCNARLDDQPGFAGNDGKWRCVYCDMESEIERSEIMREKREARREFLRVRAKKVSKNLIIVGAVAVGAAVMASEYFINRFISKTREENKEETVEEVTEETQEAQEQQ